LLILMGRQISAVNATNVDMAESVYCASPQAIEAATRAYFEKTGKFADAGGLSAALIAAHHPDLGLDRSICLADLVEAIDKV
jgi:hypothetical protein